MEPQQFGSIEPWLEQSNKLPLRLFKRKIHSTHAHFPRNNLTNLNKTEETVVRKLKTQANGITLKYQRNNEAKIISLDLTFKEHSKSSNLKHLIPSAKQQTNASVFVKKSIKGFSMSSVKKKPMNLYDLIPGNSSQNKEHKQARRIKSASHIQHLSKAVRQHNVHTKSINISKIDLKTIPIAESHDFFREIANLWKQKNKILAKQSTLTPNSELKVERQLFRNRNRKFKSWHKLKKRMASFNG